MMKQKDILCLLNIKLKYIQKVGDFQRKWNVTSSRFRCVIMFVAFSGFPPSLSALIDNIKPFKLKWHTVFQI